MEYNITAIADNRISVDRLTKIEKSENGLVNVINSLDEYKFMDVSDFIKGYFSNTEDCIIEDITVNKDNNNYIFNVCYYNFYNDNGEYNFEQGNDIFNIIVSDYQSNHVKEALCDYVVKFNNNKISNEKTIAKRINEVNRLNNKVKIETLKLLKESLKGEKSINIDISSNDFQSYIDDNIDYVKSCMRDNWKYKKVVDFGEKLSLYIGTGACGCTLPLCVQDSSKAMIALAVAAASISAFGVIASAENKVLSKTIEDTSNLLSEKNKEKVKNKFQRQ